jgi:branched-chain amino acid transport system permease protein
VDALAMVLLGGVQTLTGPLWGAALFTWLEDSVSRSFDYWRAAIGVVILLLVLAFPQGVAGFVKERFLR